MRQALIATTLLLAAFSSSALTLGRSRGAVLVGQPLDVRIQLQLDAGEDASALCFDAQVFHADNRVDAGRVTTQVEPAAAGREATLRVRSAAMVDEPVVTIYLAAGCSQKFTRRYVFLADVAPEAVAATASQSVPALPSVPANSVPAAAASARAAVPAASSGTAATSEREARRAARAQARAEARAQRAAQAKPESGGEATPKAAPSPKAAAEPAPKAARPQPVPSVVRRKPEAPAARARLKLDPLDLVAERDPTLRASTELLTPPLPDGDGRRAEAAALWKAVNAQPQDILRDMQRVQALEADVRGLRDQSTKNQANMADLKSQLQKAESERYANLLVYGLAAMLVAALALAAFLWRGTTRGGAWSGNDWWRARYPADSSASGGGPDSLLPASVPSRQPVRPSSAGASVDVDLGVDEDMFSSLKPAPAGAAGAKAPAVVKAAGKGQAAKTPAAETTGPLPRLDVSHSDFGHSMLGASRAVNAEELFDIQQQADFFISLGQYDQAIEVLKNHISEKSDTSALAYLDLLKIYHKLSRKDDYDKLRDDFNRVFNAQVPVWEAFSEQSSGLDSYAKALSRIESLWPSPKVLEIIEESIFRKPGMGDGEAFDLEAYRELLLLYAIAKDIVEQPRGGDSGLDFSSSSLGGPDGGDSELPRSRFSSTNIQPLSASLPPLQEPDMIPPLDMDPLADIPLPRPSPRLGLDIDLTEPAASAFLEAEVSDGQSMPGFDDKDESQGSISQMDIDLFDAATERDIAPRKPRR